MPKASGFTLHFGHRVFIEVSWRKLGLYLLHGESCPICNRKVRHVAPFWMEEHSANSAPVVICEIQVKVGCSFISWIFSPHIYYSGTYDSRRSPESFNIHHWLYNIRRLTILHLKNNRICLLPFCWNRNPMNGPITYVGSTPHPVTVANIGL